jgi:4-hydroxybenzoate polyprenyltransferase
VRDLLRLLRVHNLLVAAAGVLAGGWIALGRIATTKELVFAALAAAGVGAAGYVLNDLRDAPADRVNRPASERPLAVGRVSRGAAELCVFAGALLGIGAAGLVSGRAVFVALVTLVVLAAYSPLLKRYGVIGNVAIGVVAGLPLEYGALAMGRAGLGIVPWVLAAWLHVARELVKDLQDEVGDRLLDRRTLPILKGTALAARIAAWLLLAFVPVSIALPWAAGYRDPYFAFAAAAQLLVVLVANRLRQGVAGPEVARLSLVLKVAMVVGIVALVAGRTM